MPAKKNPAPTAPLHVRLLDGLDTKSRPDGTVHTIRAGSRTVAEVCVGKKNVRANFKTELPAASRKKLSGKSKSWPGGGVLVTDDNLNEVRNMLELAVSRTQAAQGASDVAADLAARKAEATATKKRVGRPARTRVAA
jgi:hypothetical protein